MHVVACIRLVSPLDSQQQQHGKRVPDGHGRSFGSWLWQKNAKGTLTYIDKGYHELSDSWLQFYYLYRVAIQ